MTVQSVNPDDSRAENLQNETSLRTDGRLRPAPPKSRKLTAANQQKVRRKPGGETARPSLARERNISEYQDIYKAWPTLPVCRRKPVDCIRPKGNIDLTTNYADVYKGVKGEVAKLTRHPVTVGTDPVPFRELSEYQDKYRVWSALPARSLKPPQYKARGTIEFVTNYSQEYKAREIQRRLPIIQLDQMALRRGPFQTATSYQSDFTRTPPSAFPVPSRTRRTARASHRGKVIQRACPATARRHEMSS
ncbi:hypothetical protein AAFF_G00271600 [Aldrovandia affinis]|uniref:Uncharacterized protein n=1 Tax=Aldrovandia affinis TaxID=143900 RepID=A0AAD7RBD1_9TELE|nr:hypothetical protein AAFF_G00271600 [Aldrovandia affinis]